MIDTFMMYAKHTQELEDIIMTIIQEIEASDDGTDNCDLVIKLDNNLSENDIAYIEKEVMRRL